VVGLLNPQVVVIGGNLAQAGEPFLGAIREAIFAGARDFALQGLLVEKTRLGHVAGVTGASLIAQDALFAADRISRLTRGGAIGVSLHTQPA
jgi:predicted NBD/HSP70 family sugar kinase